MSLEGNVEQCDQQATMEQWDFHDMEGNRTGGQMASEDVFQPGQYHLIVHVCLLIQMEKC